MLKTNGDGLRPLDAVWQRGTLRAVVDGRYPLASLGQVWQRLISGRAVWKIVIEVA